MPNVLTLKLDLILNDKVLALRVDGLLEYARDGMMRGRILRDQTLVTVDALEHFRLLVGPLADILPFLFFTLGVLLRVGDLPPALPVVCKLFEEGCFYVGFLILESADSSIGFSWAVDLTYGKLGSRDGSSLRCVSGGTRWIGVFLCIDERKQVNAGSSHESRAELHVEDHRLTEDAPAG